MSLFSRLFIHLVVEVAIEALRRSALIVVGVMALSSLGAWEYWVSSMHAVDMRLAASVQPLAPDLPKRVLMVAIDDLAYQQYFGEQSPLRQDRVATFLQTIESNAPHARRIVVDLDLAPRVDDLASQGLETLLNRNASHWVLAAAPGATKDDTLRRAQWRERLCASGVSFASPMVPTDFGHANISHQNVGALSDVAARPSGGCISPEEPLDLESAPLSPHALKDGLVLPFSGDLEMLGQAVQSLDPQWIVIGGTWGKDDLFETPFGERFGMAVHAAALTGRLNEDHQVSYFGQTMAAWVFVTLASVLLAACSKKLRRWGRPALAEMAGHRFFESSVAPMLEMGLILLMLGVVMWLLSTWWGFSGIWIPSSTVATVTLVALILNRNWESGEEHEFKSIKAALTHVVWAPLKEDCHSVKLACAALFQRPHARHAWLRISRSRLVFEGLMAICSVLMQTVLPLGALAYEFHKPL
jgi:hypothetical protein